MAVRRVTKIRLAVVASLVVVLGAIGAIAVGMGGDNDTSESATTGPATTDVAAVPAASTVPTATSEAAPASDTEASATAQVTSAPGRFIEPFDGQPGQPTPWHGASWDLTVHSRDVETFDSLSEVEAGHGPACEPPPAVHVVTAYEDAVFQCKDHMMTAINEGGYAMIYLTPNQLVDFSDGTATIRLDVSTLRTSVRDWWDVWITPYDDNLQLPLDLGTDVDVNGPPRRSVRVGLGTENQMVTQLYQDFEAVDFGEYPENVVPGDWWTGYETFLEPDLKRRDTFEIQLSADHIRVGMPAYDFWWVDADIPTLDWTQGIVQFGHHSYNPTKDCGENNNPRPAVDDCVASTWHWDNVEIDPAVPFTIIDAADRVADLDDLVLDFAQPAPDDAMLRFTGIGEDLRVRFDGGAWVAAELQASQGPNPDDHFASYWMPVPAGTTSVEFDGGEWFGGGWVVRDASFWSLTAPTADGEAAKS